MSAGVEGPSRSAAAVRVAIADDHWSVRRGLRSLVEEQDELTVVAEVADGHAAVDACLESPVDVLLLDVRMEGPGYLEIIRQLGERRPQTRVLVLSALGSTQYALAAFRRGAAGYLTKARSPEELVGAIRKVSRGGRYVDSELVDGLVGLLDRERRRESLSERELQVMRRLAGGKLVKETAAELGISPKTVSTYRARILKKLELTTTADLIRYVLANDRLPE